MSEGVDDLVAKLPKAELHVHIEGTLEPDLMFAMAARNEVELAFPTIDALRSAYRFEDLQSFLDLYFRGASVLRTRDDFASLMGAYLGRAAADGVVRAEIFFDPQTHTSRGIGFEVFMGGFRDAIAGSPVDAALILCFLRHLPAAAALTTLQEASGHLDGVIAVGLDSSEVGNPPERFEEVFDMARTMGLRTVAHAGEEGPASYITGALDVLGVERIDHGIRCLDDPDVVTRLRRGRVPLTVCPLSNLALRVVDRLEDHPLPRLLAEDLVVSLHSDDPAYFGGYIAENYTRSADALDLDVSVLAQLAANSIRSSFLDPPAKKAQLATIDELTARS